MASQPPGLALRCSALLWGWWQRRGAEGGSDAEGSLELGQAAVPFGPAVGGGAGAGGRAAAKALRADALVLVLEADLAVGLEELREDLLLEVNRDAAARRSPDVGQDVKVGREGVLVGGRCDVDVELVQRGGEGAGGGALEAGDREASLDEGLRVWIESTGGDTCSDWVT